MSLSRWWQRKYFLFSPRSLGFMIPFDFCIFFKWVGSTTNQINLSRIYRVHRRDTLAWCQRWKPWFLWKMPRKERKQINRNRTMISEMCLYGDICILFRISYICTRVCMYIYVYVHGFMHRLVASLHSVWLWLAGPVATIVYIYIYSFTVLFVRYPTFSCSVADIRLHLSNWTGRLQTSSGLTPNQGGVRRETTIVFIHTKICGLQHLMGKVLSHPTKPRLFLFSKLYEGSKD